MDGILSIWTVVVGYYLDAAALHTRAVLRSRFPCGTQVVVPLRALRLTLRKPSKAMERAIIMTTKIASPVMMATTSGTGIGQGSRQHVNTMWWGGEMESACGSAGLLRGQEGQEQDACEDEAMPLGRRSYTRTLMVFPTRTSNITLRMDKS